MRSGTFTGHAPGDMRLIGRARIRTIPAGLEAHHTSQHRAVGTRWRRHRETPTRAPLEAAKANSRLLLRGATTARDHLEVERERRALRASCRTVAGYYRHRIDGDTVGEKLRYPIRRPVATVATGRSRSVRVRRPQTRGRRIRIDRRVAEEDVHMADPGLPWEDDRIEHPNRRHRATGVQSPTATAQRALAAKAATRALDTRTLTALRTLDARAIRAERAPIGAVLSAEPTRGALPIVAGARAGQSRHERKEDNDGKCNKHARTQGTSS